MPCPVWMSGKVKERINVMQPSLPAARNYAQ